MNNDQPGLGETNTIKRLKKGDLNGSEILVKSYQDAGGHMNIAARGSLIAGLVFTMIAAIFLFNLNWTILGPALLILAGTGILLNTLLPG